MKEHISHLKITVKSKTLKNLHKNQTKCTSKGWSSVPLIQALQDQ